LEDEAVKQYILSVYQPDGPVPPTQVLGRIAQNLEVLNRDMKAAGAWVFAVGLHPPNTATVVKVQAGEVLITDGPFTEAKEHIGGFTIIRAPDLDAALEWASKLARATTLPIEVRPLRDDEGE
jgi:hypothetical protein